MVRAEKAIRCIAVLGLVMFVVACGTNKPKKAAVENRGGAQQNLGGNQSITGGGTESIVGGVETVTGGQSVVGGEETVMTATEPLDVTDIGSITLPAPGDASLAQDSDLVAGQYKLLKIQSARRDTEGSNVSVVEISHTLAVAGAMNAAADTITVTRADATQADVIQMEDAELVQNLTVAASGESRITLTANRLYKAKIKEDNSAEIELIAERQDTATVGSQLGLAALRSTGSMIISSTATSTTSPFGGSILRNGNREIRMQKIADGIVFFLISVDGSNSQITRIEYKKQ